MVVEETVENQKSTKNQNLYVVCPGEQGPNLGQFVETKLPGAWMVFTLQVRW